ncbi:MAG TPA: glycosyltransferase [Candidatus Micrarchaeaceae archaeon]|nr:glycosyltransferase [Candidatus Micrarchaeaceae archaeon]
MLTLFLICAALILYVYFGYPLLLLSGLLARRKPIASAAPDEPPLLSIIVAARNEESVIEDKLRNLLAASYPREKIEILIGSDGSSDRTEEIVRRYESEGVGLLSFPQHVGKSAIQNGLVKLASGSILVFTDADCSFPRETLPLLVANFSDSRVGLVTACPRYENERETAVTQNEGLYLRYESFLRSEESSRGLLAVASGSLFAIRRSLWQPLDPSHGDDFALPLAVAAVRSRNVLEPRAVAATHLGQKHPRSMLGLKSRIISKDLRGLLGRAPLLNPLRYGAVSIALWSHKLLRWLIPYFLVALFVSNLFLLDSALFRFALAAQLAFYALALLGAAFRDRLRFFLWSVPFSFCLVNAAALAGTLQCLARRPAGRWAPVRRSSRAA